jgi:hypothetical protein
MLLSAYAMLEGKWAIAGMAIFGWCCWATPAITRAAGNPELTLAARKQMIVLALVCIIPLLTIVVLISFSNDDGGSSRSSSPVAPRPLVKSLSLVEIHSNQDWGAASDSWWKFDCMYSAAREPRYVGSYSYRYPVDIRGDPIPIAHENL